MGVRVLGCDDEAVLYCSTTDWAFGPLFHTDHGHDAFERAELFLKWLGARDARQFTDKALESLYSQWLAQEITQWRREDGEDVE